MSVVYYILLSVFFFKRICLFHLCSICVAWQAQMEQKRKKKKVLYILLLQKINCFVLCVCLFLYVFVCLCVSPLSSAALTAESHRLVAVHQSCILHQVSQSMSEG